MYFHRSIFTNDEIVVIRYVKFCAEIYLGINKSFDNSNFNELLKAINIIENQDEKTNYLVAICNTLNQVHEYYPEWSIKLIDEILELVHVIEKKDEHIEHLKKKLEFKEVKFKDEDIDELFDRNI
jgi:hypothetical protein